MFNVTHNQKKKVFIFSLPNINFTFQLVFSEYGFSDNGWHTTTDMPITVYQQVALIKNWNIDKDKNSKINKT